MQKRWIKEGFGWFWEDEVRQSSTCPLLYHCRNILSRTLQRSSRCSLPNRACCTVCTVLYWMERMIIQNNDDMRESKAIDWLPVLQFATTKAILVIFQVGSFRLVATASYHKVMKPLCKLQLQRAIYLCTSRCSTATIKHYSKIEDCSTCETVPKIVLLGLDLSIFYHASKYSGSCKVMKPLCKLQLQRAIYLCTP